MDVQQIKQPSKPAPVTAVAAIRYLVSILLPVMVAKGWIAADSVEGVSTLLIALGTMLYGLWKTHDRQKRLTAIQHGFQTMLAYMSHQTSAAAAENSEAASATHEGEQA